MEYAVCAVYLILVGLVLAVRGRPAYPAAKALAGAGFCAVAAVSAAGLPGTGWPWPLPAAFALCAGGDVAMGLYNLRRRTAALRWGVLLFAGGHLCFLIGLWRLGRPQLPALVFAALSAAVLLGLLGRGVLDMGRLGGWGAGYCFAVSLMAGQALTRAAALPRTGPVLFGVGAALFWLSDLILLLLYFSPKKGSRALHIANLVSYYAAMLLMALSLGWPPAPLA